MDLLIFQMLLWSKPMLTIVLRFAKGKKPGQRTGFDIDEADLLEMEECHDVVVASAIFGIVILLSMLLWLLFCAFDGLIDSLMSSA